jgi:hypothetical protein
VAVQFSASTFVQGGSSVLRMKFSAKTPRHRKGPKRYAPLTTPAKRTHQEIFAQSKINTYF